MLSTLALGNTMSCAGAGPMAMKEAGAAMDAPMAEKKVAPPADALEREQRNVPAGREKPPAPPLVEQQGQDVKIADKRVQAEAKEQAFEMNDMEMAGEAIAMDEPMMAPAADMEGGFGQMGDGLFGGMDDGDEDVWFDEDGDNWRGGGGDWGGGGGPYIPPPPEWAPVREFPAPDYSTPYTGPRVDFRDTIYWNPDVQTDAQGQATLSFYLSDAVTGFRATAEGISYTGTVGRGDTLITSKLPVSLGVKFPIEVSRGDVLEIPITLTNASNAPLDATLTASFGKALTLKNTLPATVTLAAGERSSFRAQVKVTGLGMADGDGEITVAIEAAGAQDEISRTLNISPPGFPQEISLAGTLSGSAKHTLTLPANHVEGTLVAKATLYPSPVASMIQGTEAMIREPYGCFEQASSSNYPNIMVLNYLETYDARDADLKKRTQDTLDRGYQLITGYESPNKGYEWFGSDPGHEALTAYGLMEFADMSRVYDVDQDMIARTANWLKSRRDGEGGYQRNAQALDSFGAAGPEVTNAYITYALTEAGQSDIETELNHLEKLGLDTKDPYILALSAAALANARPDSANTKKALKRLARRQADNGSFPGANHSITRSGGIALTIETTAIATLALLEAGGYTAELQKAVEFLNTQRDGWGGYGSTQSTVLALKAISAYAEKTAKLPDGSIIEIYVNGERAHQISLDSEVTDPMTVGGIAHLLKPGDNTLEIKLDNDTPLPYSILVTYQANAPDTSDKAPVALTTQLRSETVTWGESLAMDVTVSNVRDKGLPMVIARVGLPGGLTFQSWQLKELKEKGTIDFYETREREVILYWRDMEPSQQIQVPLELMSTVPGTYTGIPSSAYLYYTDEHKVWTPPVNVSVTP